MLLGDEPISSVLLAGASMSGMLSPFFVRLCGVAKSMHAVP